MTGKAVPRRGRVSERNFSAFQQTKPSWPIRWCCLLHSNKTNDPSSKDELHKEMSCLFDCCCYSTSLMSNEEVMEGSFDDFEYILTLNHCFCLPTDIQWFLNHPSTHKMENPLNVSPMQVHQKHDTILKHHVKKTWLSIALMIFTAKKLCVMTLMEVVLLITSKSLFLMHL